MNDDHLFGLTNLPYGVYSVDGSAPRVGTRLGGRVIDLARLFGDPDGAVFAAPSLNPFMAQGPQRWHQVRAALGAALADDVDHLPAGTVFEVGEVELHLPFEVADYVDFYASEQHATNLGRLFRPEAPDPLTPNWRHLPISYTGRAGSIVVSGTDVVRPCGQSLRPGATVPEYGPTERLDLEAEVGFVVGVGNAMGSPVPALAAREHLFGVVLFNDWSARDLQAWEYVPLGPHLGKSFASTVSPWVVPLAALDAARVATPPQRPAPIGYLAMQVPWGLALDLEIELNGEVISRPPYASTYWSPAQMLAHLTANGAPTRTGDLFASGTVSGAGAAEVGSLIERGGGFLADGDEVVLRATAPGADGTRIGFGEARGRITPARFQEGPR
jgi:fumarylacetoacetase